MTSTKLTAALIRSLVPGERARWMTDPGPRGSGRLMLAIRPASDGGGRLWYFAYENAAGKRERLPIGPYDEAGDGASAFTLKQARDRAAEWSGLYRAGVRDLRQHFERERARAVERDAAEDAARRQAQAEAGSGTLRQLLDAYCDSLDARGASSARDTRNGFRLHILEPFPDLAGRKAREIEPAAITPVLRRLLDEGKGRSAMKLRSHLHAAFKAAIAADTDATAPPTLKGFQISTNPISPIAALTEQSQARTRTLKQPELRAYIEGVRAIKSETVRAALLTALLLGGQRPEMLLRATASDVDFDARTLRLYDIKGRNGWKKPRARVLPLTDAVIAILRPLAEKNREAPSLFSSDGRRAPVSSTMSHAVNEIAKSMLAKKVSTEHFEQRDVRRTAETMLAALGVPSDVRARLLSHGVTGIQATTYDKYSYHDEMFDALNRWQSKLAEIEKPEAPPTAPARAVRKPAFNAKRSRKATA
jgi:integrase